jgi:hypothetical protein
MPKAFPEEFRPMLVVAGATTTRAARLGPLGLQALSVVRISCVRLLIRTHAMRTLIL